VFVRPTTLRASPQAADDWPFCTVTHRATRDAQCGPVSLTSVERSSSCTCECAFCTLSFPKKYAQRFHPCRRVLSSVCRFPHVSSSHWFPRFRLLWISIAFECRCSSLSPCLWPEGGIVFHPLSLPPVSVLRSSPAGFVSSAVCPLVSLPAVL